MGEMKRYDHSFIGFDEAAVIDVETTGLSSVNDRIVDVAVLRGDFSKLLKGATDLDFDSFEARVNPGVPIPQAASRVHGIHDVDVADLGTFGDIAQQLRDFIGDRPLVGHNVSFDKRFLSAEFKRAGVKTLQRNQSYCTMRRFQETFPEEKKDLASVAAKHGRKRTGQHHGAKEDAVLTAEIAFRFYRIDNGYKSPRKPPFQRIEVRDPIPSKESYSLPPDGVKAMLWIAAIAGILAVSTCSGRA